MAILNIRQLPDPVHASLRVRAARNGRSMEAEARDILARACAGAYDAPQGSSVVREGQPGQLTITLSPRQAEAALTYARQHHTTVQDWVRQLLERELQVDADAWCDELFRLMDEAGGDLRGATWTRDDIYDRS